MRNMAEKKDLSSKEKAFTASISTLGYNHRFMLLGGDKPQNKGTI